MLQTQVTLKAELCRKTKLHGMTLCVINMTYPSKSAVINDISQ